MGVHCLVCLPSSLAVGDSFERPEHLLGRRILEIQWDLVQCPKLTLRFELSLEILRHRIEYFFYPLEYHLHFPLIG